MVREKYMYLPEEEGLEGDDDEEIPASEGWRLIVEAMNLLHQADEVIENLQEKRRTRDTHRKQPQQVTTPLSGTTQ